MIEPYHEIFLFTSLFIFGVRGSSGEGMILERIHDWLYLRLPEWIYKPTIGCSICMSSLYGTFSYWFYAYDYLGSSSLTDGLYWLYWVVCLAGFNYVVSSIMTR